MINKVFLLLVSWWLHSNWLWFTLYYFLTILWLDQFGNCYMVIVYFMKTHKLFRILRMHVYVQSRKSSLCFVTDINWLGGDGAENFYSIIADDENVQQLISDLSNIVTGKLQTQIPKIWKLYHWLIIFSIQIYVVHKIENTLYMYKHSGTLVIW